MPHYIGLRGSQNYTINPITLLKGKTNGLVNKIISLEGSNSPSYVSLTNYNIKKLRGAVINRLWIGHARIIDGHPLAKGDLP